jgi:hypothetical protein
MKDAFGVEVVGKAAHHHHTLRLVVKEVRDQSVGQAYSQSKKKTKKKIRWLSS